MYMFGIIWYMFDSGGWIVLINVGVLFFEKLLLYDWVVVVFV